jgi:hypothetical protein
MRRRFSFAGEEIVDGGELAGDADRTPDEVGLALKVEAGNLDLPAVCGQER